VRKEISSLRKSGLINSKEGMNGGYELAKSPAKITLAEVYRSFGKSEILGRAKNIPNPDCPVGRQITKNIENLYQQLDNDLLLKLEKVTLAEFSNQFE
jgi:Rrf2 family protein